MTLPQGLNLRPLNSMAVSTQEPHTALIILFSTLYNTKLIFSTNTVFPLIEHKLCWGQQAHACFALHSILSVSTQHSLTQHSYLPLMDKWPRVIYFGDTFGSLQIWTYLKAHYENSSPKIYLFYLLQRKLLITWLTTSYILFLNDGLKRDDFSAVPKIWVS